MDLGGRQRPQTPHLHPVGEAVQRGIEPLRVTADQIERDRSPPGGEETHSRDRQSDVLARVGQVAAADEQAGGGVAVAFGPRPPPDHPAGWRAVESGYSSPAELLGEDERRSDGAIRGAVAADIVAVVEHSLGGHRGAAGKAASRVPPGGDGPPDRGMGVEPGRHHHPVCQRAESGGQGRVVGVGRVVVPESGQPEADGGAETSGRVAGRQPLQPPLPRGRLFQTKIDHADAGALEPPLQRERQPRVSGQEGHVDRGCRCRRGDVLGVGVHPADAAVVNTDDDPKGHPGRRAPRLLLSVH